MGIGIRNLEALKTTDKVSSGMLFHEYLEDQILENLPKVGFELGQEFHNYGLGDIKLEVDPQAEQDRINEVNKKAYELFTSCSGPLADKLNLTGSLSSEKLKEIASIEMGNHEICEGKQTGKTKTERSVKVLRYKKNYYVLSKKDIEQEHTLIDGQLVKIDFEKVKDRNVSLVDLKNGYLEHNKEKLFFPKSTIQNDLDSKDKKSITAQYNHFLFEESNLKVKTGIEFLFTLDPTFSYAINLMEDQDKEKAYKLFNDTMRDVFHQLVGPHVKNYDGEDLDYLFYTFTHQDNREGKPFVHAHGILSNFGVAKNGKKYSIELPCITEKDWHHTQDQLMKRLMTDRWNEMFKSFQVEGYDKDGEKIDPKNPFQQIKDYRIAFNEESLKKINLESKTSDKIEKIIKEEKKQLKQSFEKKVNSIEDEIKAINEYFELNSNLVNLNDIGHITSIEQGIDKFGKAKLIITVESEKFKEPKKFYKNISEEKSFREKFKEKDVISISPLNNFSNKDINWKTVLLNDEIKEKFNALDLLKFELKAETEEFYKKLKYLNSRKHEDHVWSSIKDDKVNVGITNKNTNLKDKSKSLGLEMDAVVGASKIERDYKQIEEILTNISPYFSRNQLKVELARTGEYEDVEKLATEYLENLVKKGDLIPMPDPNQEKRKAEMQIKMKGKNKDIKCVNEKTEIVYVPKDLIIKEQENMTLARKNVFACYRNRTLTEKQIQKRFKEFLDIQKENGIIPNEEQENFILATSGSSKVLNLVNGLPGTGKSFTLKLSLEFQEYLFEHETNTMGEKIKPKFMLVAPSSLVSKALDFDINKDRKSIDNDKIEELSNAGVLDMSEINKDRKGDNIVPHYTLDKLLLDFEKGKVNFNDGVTQIFVDESGMVGCRNINKLLKMVESSQKFDQNGNLISGPRLVLQGDHAQLTPVAVGLSFYSMFHDDPVLRQNFTHLKEIRRQKTDVSKAIAQTITMAKIKDENYLSYRESRKHVEDTIKIIQDNGLLYQFKTTEDKINQLAQDYLNSVTNKGDKTTFNKKVILTSTNAEIDLINQKIQELRLERGELDSSQKIDTMNYSFYVNDRIIMKKNDRDHDYSNGDLGTIIATDGTNTIVRLDNDKIIKVSERQMKFAKPSYALSVHASQGQTLDDVMFDLVPSQVNDMNLFLVALTRTTDKNRLYVLEDEKEHVLASFSRLPNKLNLLDIGKSYGINNEYYTQKEVVDHFTNEFKKQNVELDVSNINPDFDKVRPAEEIKEITYDSKKVQWDFGFKNLLTEENKNNKTIFNFVENGQKLYDKFLDNVSIIKDKIKNLKNVKFPFTRKEKENKTNYEVLYNYQDNPHNYSAEIKQHFNNKKFERDENYLTPTELAQFNERLAEDNKQIVSEVNGKNQTQNMIAKTINNSADRSVFNLENNPNQILANSPTLPRKSPTPGKRRRNTPSIDFDNT